MRLCLTFLLAFCVSWPATAHEPKAEPRSFDFNVVPADCLAAIAIRDLSDLKRKTIGLAQQTDASFSSLLTIAATMGTSMLRDQLGFGQSLDESGSAAFVSFAGDDDYAIIMPITSVSDAALAFDVNEDALAAGKLIRSTKRNWIDDFWMAAKGKYVVVGHQNAVAKVLKSEGLSRKIGQQTRATFVTDDLFLTFDFVKMRELLEEGELQPNHGVFSLVPQNIVGLAAAGELNRVCIGLDVEKGFDGTLLFDFDGEESKQVLTKLGNQSRKCNLNGLPPGQIVFATSRSTGPESGDLLREAAEYFAADFGGLLGIREMIAPNHAAGLTSILNEGLKRVHISRAALYRNNDAEQSGAFSFIGILDTDDAQEFIKETRELVPIFNASLHPDEELDERIDEKTITKMVSFLAHDNQRARDFITGKLRMLGRHALPALRKSAGSDDPQVRGRAQRLITEIESDLSIQRAEFLAGRITDQLQPSFGYLVDFEKRDGRSVDVIRMDLAEQDKTVTAQLRAMLGPDWNKIRMTRVNDQIVLMLGSNTRLLDEALANMSNGSLGVEAEDHYATFRQKMPGELIAELHFSMADAVAMAGKPIAKDAQQSGDATTSMGLSVSPQQVRFDFLIPIAEINALVKVWQ